MTTMLLVQGDTKSQIQATITRADSGSAVDLNDASSIVLRFRKEYSAAIIYTLTGSEADSGDYELGKVLFEFTDLDVDPGNYEGEIEVTYFSDGTKETVFEVIKFIVREDFG